MGRSTDFEFNRRIEEVANLLVIEQKRAEIVQFAAKNEWDISNRQVDEYIHRAKILLKKEAEESTKNRLAERAKAKRALITMRNKCMNIQDYGRAIQAQKEINKLFALYEPQESILSQSDSRVELLIKYENRFPDDGNTIIIDPPPPPPIPDMDS